LQRHPMVCNDNGHAESVIRRRKVSSLFCRYDSQSQARCGDVPRGICAYRRSLGSLYRGITRRGMSLSCPHWCPQNRRVCLNPYGIMIRRACSHSKSPLDATCIGAQRTRSACVCECVKRQRLAIQRVGTAARLVVQVITRWRPGLAEIVDRDTFG